MCEECRDSYCKTRVLPYAAGTPGMYNTFAKDFVSNVNIYTVQYPGHGDDREIKATVDEVGELLFGELQKV